MHLFLINPNFSSIFCHFYLLFFWLLPQKKSYAPPRLPRNMQQDFSLLNHHLITIKWLFNTFLITRPQVLQHRGAAVPRQKRVFWSERPQSLAYSEFRQSEPPRWLGGKDSFEQILRGGLLIPSFNNISQMSGSAEKKLLRRARTLARLLRTSKTRANTLAWQNRCFLFKFPLSLERIEVVLFKNYKRPKREYAQ